MSRKERERERERERRVEKRAAASRCQMPDFRHFALLLILEHSLLRDAPCRSFLVVLV